MIIDSLPTETPARNNNKKFVHLFLSEIRTGINLDSRIFHENRIKKSEKITSVKMPV